MLDPRSPVVAARLRDEGVPAADTATVANELKRVLPFATTQGSDVAVVRLHPWTMEILARYGEKIVCIFMASRGKVEPR